MNVFLPCRKGSSRVPRKNVRSLPGYGKGLLEIKLKQLLQISKVDSIFLSTNDEEIIDFANTINDSKINIIKRSEYLSSNQTQTDELVAHVIDIVKGGDVIWTHVTSPFFNIQCYERAIEEYYLSIDNGFDSLMSVNRLQGFFWNKTHPLNYNREKQKWPQTQNIEPIFEINSACFIANIDIYKEFHDRIGKKPYFFETDKISGFDIDWEDDFVIAESILRNRINNI